MSIEHKAGLRDMGDLERRQRRRLPPQPSGFLRSPYRTPQQAQGAASQPARRCRSSNARWKCCASSTARWNASWWTSSKWRAPTTRSSNASIVWRWHCWKAPHLPERLYALQEELRERFGADEVSLFLHPRRIATDMDAGPARWLKRDDAGLDQFREFLKVRQAPRGTSAAAATGVPVR